jgi:hypothetical protein
MKALVCIISLALSFSFYAQDALLFQYDWRLESITTNSEVYTPSPTPNHINFGTDFDYLYFYDYDGYYGLSFGIFNNVWGDNIIYDNINSSFYISNTYLTLGMASPASTYFLHNFLNTAFNGSIQNPFSYDFTHSGDLVYLHITNLAGSVATFYATNLSREAFLKDVISVYPNPVNDVLKIEHPGVVLDHVNIYDMNGRLVEEYQKVINPIDVSHLQKGIYILEINTSMGDYRRKLLKK